MNENNNTDVFSTLFSFAGSKLKIIIFSIFCVFFLIFFVILMIGAVNTNTNNNDNDYDKNGNPIGDYSGSTGSSQPGEIINQDGLSWIGSDHTFCSPVQKLTGIGSGFGKKGSAWSLGYHTGTDMFGNLGTNIVAVYQGKVVQAINAGSYGNHVVIEHNYNGFKFYTLYAHMMAGSLKVSTGQEVQQGQVLGIIGQTGNAFGIHCHFEVRYPKNAFNATSLHDPIAELYNGGIKNR